MTVKTMKIKQEKNYLVCRTIFKFAVFHSDLGYLLEMIRDFLYHHMMQLQKPEDFKTSGSKINMLGHLKVLSLTYFSGP